MIKSTTLFLLSLSTVSAFSPTQYGNAFVGRHSVVDKKASLGALHLSQGGEMDDCNGIAVIFSSFRRL